MALIDCTGRTIRAINLDIRAHLAGGAPEVRILNPAARHNIAVGLERPGQIVIQGPVGNYCAGLANVANVDIRGHAGWAVAENLMSGQVVVRGNAGAAAGASMRGGTLVIHGHAANRCAAVNKGGTVIVGGNAGASTAFMMQKGTVIICGNAGPGLGDSIYLGRIFLGGDCPQLGADVVEAGLAEGEGREVHSLLAAHGIPAPARLRKLVSGRRLWNFTTKERDVWKTAL